ncbi:hypothetical protein ABQE69_09120 [Mycolicibacillus trivialis]
MTAEEFKAGIQEVIEQTLDTTGSVIHPDTQAVAEAVHTYIVNKLQPPF